MPEKGEVLMLVRPETCRPCVLDSIEGCMGFSNAEGTSSLGVLMLGGAQ
jgi:hypothetical protein